MKADKKNGGICFNEEYHKYWDENDPSKKFISVTTLIEKFGQDFDKKFWSKYKALQVLADKNAWKTVGKDLLNSKDSSMFNDKLLARCKVSRDNLDDATGKILREWEENNKQSCNRGTKIHLGFENGTYENKDDIRLDEYGIDGKFKCNIGYGNIDIPDHVYPEFLLSWSSPDKKLNIAGQSDLVVLKGNDELYIIDYKGLPLNTPILTDRGFVYMKDIVEGDHVFDQAGAVQTVSHKSSVHNNPCYTLIFDNGESITCDKDHRWLVTDGKKQKVMTAEEIMESEKQLFIDNHKAVDYCTGEVKLKEDPYFYGLCGNTSIPEELLLSSITQRRNLLNGYMDDNGAYESTEKVLHPKGSHKDILKLLGTLGIKAFDSKDEIRFNDDSYDDKYTRREIVSVRKTDSVPTQCIQVTGDTHTYLCTYNCIVTHNTNKEIKLKSFYDIHKKMSEKMKFPLDELDDCNYKHYQMQLSMYAWMAQQKWKNLKVKDLMLRHIDHTGKEKIYHCEYLKDKVVDMIDYYHMLVVDQEQEKKYKKIVY